MDPLATLRALDQAITQGEWFVAVELLTSYYQWRLKRGAEPLTSSLSSTYPKGDGFASFLAIRLCDRMDHPASPT